MLNEKLRKISQWAVTLIEMPNLKTSLIFNKTISWQEILSSAWIQKKRVIGHIL